MSVGEYGYYGSTVVSECSSMKSVATVGLSMTIVILLFLFLCATNRKKAPRVTPCRIG